ncbi:MAG: 3-hydroxybutyryl-CoA dehydrogenase [Pseudomonadota bacterium]
MKSMGVIGAGQMGNGIAHVAALAGLDVVLSDLDLARATGGKETIAYNLRRQVAKSLITQEDMDAALARIEPVDTIAALNHVDIAVEAATENEDVKKQILETLCKDLQSSAVIATNTSSLSITRLASVTDRPEKFMGMHFMNPVPLMKLVEVIRGIQTDQETFTNVTTLAKDLGKIVVNSEDFPAFIVNRILVPMINEAVYTLYEGVGSVGSIDAAMKLGANHPMGPLQLADFIGLDTCLSIMQVLYEGLADSKYRPCPLLVKYVEAGWLGQKTKRGFYDYRGDGEPEPTR